MRWVGVVVELSGVALIALAGMLVYMPVGIAVVGGYLVYLSWEGSSHDDEA